MKKNLFTRREFLVTSLAALGTIQIVRRHVLGGPNHTAPSETLTRGVVGVGSMGRNHVRSIGTGARLLAVCDVDEQHLRDGQRFGGSGVKAYKDFRELLERKDIDVV